MKYFTRYTLVGIITCILLLLTTSSFSQEEYRDDCNLALQEITSSDYGLFTKEDIEKAYANLRSNCPPMKPDTSIPQSTYFFDHLIRIKTKELNGEGESIGLTSDKQGLKFKELVDQSIKIAESENTNIPSALQAEYDQLRDRGGTYDQNKAKYQGIYKGSDGLYAKYLALCDLARGLNFNPQIVRTTAGTKTLAVNTKYNNCLEDIYDLIASKQNIITSTIEVVNQNAKTKIQQAVNRNADGALKEMTTTSTEAKNNYVDTSKKVSAGGAMKNCNP